MRAALLLAGVAGQLDPVDGEHVASDQPEPVARHEHLGEQHADLRPELPHELGDMGVARPRVTAKGHEEHVVLAGLLDLAAADESPAVRQQHDLEHDPRVVRRSTRLVVAEPRIQS